MTIVGLYRDIYGIQPKPTYLSLDPHLSPELNGTRLRYSLRSQEYVIVLSTHGAGITANGCRVDSPTPFGFNTNGTITEYFPGTSKKWALKVTSPKNQNVTININAWPSQSGSLRQWTEKTTGTARVNQEVAGLSPGAVYKLVVDGHQVTPLRVDKFGRAAIVARPTNELTQLFKLLPAE